VRAHLRQGDVFCALLDEEELSVMTDPELLAYEPEQVGARRDPRARGQQLNAVSK
jgi:hypothetical protein